MLAFAVGSMLAGSAFFSPALAGSPAPLSAAVPAPERTYSLADDFSYDQAKTNHPWSFRLDRFDLDPPKFPLLSANDRDANALWGSDFPTPPRMWSEAGGYWGIGKNLTGHELVSTRNGTRWAPGEVLFHPKGGAAPARLVIGWTAPESLLIDVRYALGPAAVQGNGIGYQIARQRGETVAELVALKAIEGGVTNELMSLAVHRGDQLLFRFDDCGDPGGDITRAEIFIKGHPLIETKPTAGALAGGAVTEGSAFTFSVAETAAKKFQWCKDSVPIAGATRASYRLSQVKKTEAGAYSVTLDDQPGTPARLEVRPATFRPERFASPVPRQLFSSSLAEQEQELKTNTLMVRFARSRKKMAGDLYRPAYHFVSPESQLNDPNGLCFWQGRWHLFYQGYPPDEFPEPKDIPKRRQHWGHAVSEDLVHWRDLPYAIYPGVERMCFSGSTVVEENRVVAFYLGIDAGQMVAISSDPLLLNWEKPGGKAVKSPAGDACIWKEKSAYFGLVGAGLVTSTNLADWTVLPGFLEGNPFPLGDASACPNFVPIGRKHLFLSFSHSLGGQYLLGDYQAQTHRFKPYAKGRFNHGAVSPGGVHAPSAAADGQGGVINILNINDGRHSDDWDQIMSLPQQLTLGSDERLRLEPVAAMASLRERRWDVGQTVLPANQEIVLESIQGNTLELEVELEPGLARWVQLNVLRSPGAEEQTSINFYNFDRKLSVWYDTKAVVSLDGTRSSTSPDVWLRPPETVTLDRGSRDWASAPTITTAGAPVELRVFVDRSVVEVFVNGRQYLAQRVYPARADSLGVSLRAQGREATLKRLTAWKMKSIWP